MRVAIMQPYFLPYIGYWQLMNEVDVFVVYDNIQFTRKGWIHRNRMLQNDKDEYFSLPLKKDSDYKDVVERYLSEGAEIEMLKLIRRLEGNYRKAPYFEEIYPLINQVLSNSERNLFRFIYDSMAIIKEKLSIRTKLIVSSEIEIDHTLKSQDKVIAICSALNATAYLNPIGGLELYQKEVFEQQGIELKFLKSKLETYVQFNNTFVPGLSIMDILMFNSIDNIKYTLQNEFELV
jgi:hypothetical protein